MKQTQTTEPSELESQIAMMEENLAAAEKALLILAHNIERWRILVDEIKAAQNWTWKIPAPVALFGDTILFREYDVRVVQK